MSPPKTGDSTWSLDFLHAVMKKFNTIYEENNSIFDQ
jgi:hypothetical protein